MKTYETDIVKVNPNSKETYYLHTEFLQCLQANGECKIKVNEKIGKFKVGIDIKWGELVTEVEFINDNAFELEMEIAFGISTVTDNSLKVKGALSVRNGKNIIPNSKTISTTATEVAPYEEKRTNILLQNNSNVDIWIGDLTLNIANKNGWKIAPNGTLSLAVSSPIFAIASAETKLSYIKILEG
jgi:hypothetical protein